MNPLRIQLVSDLHQEFIDRRFPGQHLIYPAPDADVLILAGDIALGTEGIRMFAQWPVPVLYVAGNHEFYGGILPEIRKEMQAAAEGTSVVLLENDVADFSRFKGLSAEHLARLQGARFLGCTLWTDYLMMEPCVMQRQAMGFAHRGINDHRLIKFSSNGEPFLPKNALRENNNSQTWLLTELTKPFDGPTVVITHHGPHKGSVHERYKGVALNAAFCSHLPELVELANLWVHGHVHDSFDYLEQTCRVVTNPRGYPRNLASVEDTSGLTFENPMFNPQYVIKV